MITITVHAVDGPPETVSFRKPDIARNYARKMVGRHPSISASGYAVSSDGVCTVSVEGMSIWELFKTKPSEV